MKTAHIPLVVIFSALHLAMSAAIFFLAGHVGFGVVAALAFAIIPTLAGPVVFGVAPVILAAFTAVALLA